ncbi:MAG: hypothetical protein K0U12_01930 [Gammaproteobacteria bacterium]|nr:hypothetical protein [Gammaproteobacteria bacterium]
MVLRIFLIFAIAVLLTACQGMLAKSKTSHEHHHSYRCSYRNITTQEDYVVRMNSHQLAKQQALARCEQGRFGWNCRFQGCQG